MQIHVNDSVLSIFRQDDEATFFDHSGRTFAAWDQGWFISHGLSGRSVARRWKQGRREIRALKPQEISQLERRTRQQLEMALQEDIPSNAQKGFRRCLEYNRAQDIDHFHSVYHPVGILPPDQYNACVVQVTEGCGWNQCHFCTFYRNQAHRIKNRTQIRSHIQKIADYLGDGLSLRSSIFLSEANALAAPMDILLYAMKTSREELVPKMPHFRGFYSFNEVTDSTCKTEEDFRTLGAAGLRRLYYGLETAHTELRSRLGKPGHLAAITESIQHAKAAGVRVALIILAGAGGQAWAEKHTQASIAYLRALPIDLADLVYISPLYGPDGTKQSPLSPTEMDSQIAKLRQALADKARVAPYDIREFVY
jgi:radical SAM superfamily enzyme YgiQ (UPF0313 family)